MRSHDEIHQKILELERQYKINLATADNKKNGLTIEDILALEKINDCIAIAAGTLRWVLDSAGVDPLADIVKALIPKKGDLLHKGRQ